ncbi:hypothetical protein EVA_21490 [gut metagenome]|uniref:Uncharacterized protein n=1 Tax=gut metagenome TaxID=749906 RepID=J9BS30_9ZZZZ
MAQHSDTDRTGRSDLINTGYFYRTSRQKNTHFSIRFNMPGYALMHIDATMLEQITEAQI